MGWDPAAKTANLTITNGGRTVSSSVDGAKARATTGRETGKWYFELTLDFGFDPDYEVDFGFLPSTFVLAEGLSYTSSEVNSIRLYQYRFEFAGTDFYLANAYQQFQEGPGEGVTYCMAVDFDARLIWFRKNSGTWNATAGGTQNPELGLGGFSFASLAVLPYFPTINLLGFGEAVQVTSGFEDADMVYAIPEGFSAWDAASAGVDTPHPNGQMLAMGRWMNR
ncbi:hypothetical protein ACFFTN_01395 [Aminobacter aganoensis]|uniref:B30.2/SPRY domain-containing protein n=1 Tax=Aminobacter aganoensis TaxID=83264 RepID=A0A7X0F5H1_9HYPH|nr:hypothetical protein [Aminobacter aganoensis]MBB6353486.1 hypothetical protein [Aminobacter aganoensis]